MDASALFILVVCLLRGGLVQASDYFTTSSEMDWPDAQDYCKSKSGSLVVFDTVDKWNAFKLSNFYSQSAPSKFWTGHRFELVTCSASAGCYVDDRLLWLCTNFPSLCNDPQCIYVKDGGLEQHHCPVGHRHGVVCEIATPPTVPTTTTSTVETTTTPTTTTETTPVTSTTSTTTETTTTTTTSPPTTTTTSTTTQTTPASTTASSIPREGLDDALQELRSQLIVRKNETSLYRRNLVSVYDARADSVVIASLVIGVAVLFVGGFVVIPDVIILVKTFL